MSVPLAATVAEDVVGNITEVCATLATTPTTAVTGVEIFILLFTADDTGTNLTYYDMLRPCVLACPCYSIEQNFLYTFLHMAAFFRTM